MKSDYKKSVWAVLGNSESGDHYLALFEKKPTKAQLSKLVHEWDGSPQKDGPAYDGSYVHIDVTKEELRS